MPQMIDPHQERFDRLTRLAKRLFEVPVALVNLTDGTRQWFKSKAGVDTGGVSLYVTFCSEANPNYERVIIPDVLEHAGLREHALVTDRPHIRFFAGVPLKGPQGEVLGSLCLIDYKVRELDPELRTLLDDLAAMAAHELSAMHLATMDELTELSNRRGFRTQCEHAMGICRRFRRSGSLFFFDLDNMKRINDLYGHAAGDQALKLFAEALEETFRESDVIGRIGGDEFVVFVTGTSAEEAEQAAERLEDQVAKLKSRFEHKLSYSVGVVEFDPDSSASLDDLLNSADRLMYRQKHQPRDPHDST